VPLLQADTPQLLKATAAHTQVSECSNGWADFTLRGSCACILQVDAVQLQRDAAAGRPCVAAIPTGDLTS
jgi:hypothetical protein